MISKIIFFTLLILLKTYRTEPLNQKLKISTEQRLMQPIASFLPKKFKDTPITSIKMLSVKHENTRTISQSTCNIIRAPNHQPYRLIKKLKHRLEDSTEWYRIVLEEFVIYRLEDIQKLDYALDLEVVGDIVVVVFPDGFGVFYQFSKLQVLEEVLRKKICNTTSQIRRGKFVVLQKNAIFMSEQCAAIINMTALSIQQLTMQVKPQNLANAITYKDKQQKINILTAEGKQGFKHFIYSPSSNSLSLKKQHNVSVLGVNATIVDLLDITDLVGANKDMNRQLVVLDPMLGLLRVSLSSNSVILVQGEQTSVDFQNCRMLVLSNKLVYTSCPQVIAYDPVADKEGSSPIISQLPTEIIPGRDILTIISHNSFQKVDQCSGAVVQGDFEGDSFHHTARFGSDYVSVDEASVIVWKIQNPQYFIVCKGDSQFIGDTNIQLAVDYPCIDSVTGEKKCCAQNFQLKLEIYDSRQGPHVFEITGIAVLIFLSMMATACILRKKRQVDQQYNLLLQKDKQHESMDISVINDKKSGHTITEESIIPEENEKKIERSVFN